MKIHFKSHYFLKEKISSFFKQRNETYLFIDPYNDQFKFDLKQCLQDSSKHLNLVFVGGFVSRLINLRELPLTNVKIWVLCSRSKLVLEKMLGFDKNSIGVIPRYNLMSHGVMKDFDLIYQPHFIYAGRFSALKGIYSAIELVNVMQTNYDLPILLDLVGESSPMSAINFNISDLSDSINAKMLSHINSRKWIIKPRIHPTKKDWTRLVKDNSVFISTSYLSHEDFGVSLAQAQHLGMPSILSSWGGHLDANLGNTIYLNDFFPKSHSKELKRQAMNNALTVKNFLESMPPKKPSLEIQLPQPYDFRDVYKIVLESDKKYPGILTAATHGLHRWINSKSGGHFFKNYNYIFSGK